MKEEIFSEEDILSRLTVNELIDMIQKLPQGCRMVFNLYVFEGLKHAEIARELGISEGTSKSNLHDARLMLQKRLLSILEFENKKANKNG